VELGATKDGKITGIKLRVIADCGAYPADATLMPLLTGLMASGVYQIPKVDFAFQAVVTNTTPIGAYRGAGRPEATALLERAMDQLAVKLDMDPAELRRRNFIQPDAFPLTTVAGASYDSGEYEQALDKVLENSGYHELRAQQAERRASGDPKQLGIGLATYVELTGMGSEIGTCIVDEDGKVTVSSGTSPQGQGHDTMFAAIVSPSPALASGCSPTGLITHAVYTTAATKMDRARTKPVMVFEYYIRASSASPTVRTPMISRPAGTSAAARLRSGIRHRRKPS